MAIHYPENNLKILDYNRVLKTLNDIPTEDFLARVSDSYEVRLKGEGESKKPSEKFESSLLLGGKWYSIRVK